MFHLGEGARSNSSGRIALMASNMPTRLIAVKLCNSVYVRFCFSLIATLPLCHF